MEKGHLLLAILLSFLMMGSGVHGLRFSNRRLLFAFGDSYADTGNLGKIRGVARSWFDPYGMTFPHRPTGRFSDGRVLTDFLAKYLEIKSPVPYKYRALASPNPTGMNFALGGSGILDCSTGQKNLTAQIDEFEEQINAGVFAKCDLMDSVALVTISGNDYSYYYAKTGDALATIEYATTKVVPNLKSSLHRLNEIGVGMVLVTTLAPLGCLPELTHPYYYKKCYEAGVLLTKYHNSQLSEAINCLKGTISSGAIDILPVTDAFNAIINNGTFGSRFDKILEPCCDAVGNGTYCGDVDERGVKQYTVCCRPERAFFWDTAHPTQAGWAAIFDLLVPGLKDMLC